jgi:hypothetical protein
MKLILGFHVATILQPHVDRLHPCQNIGEDDIFFPPAFFNTHHKSRKGESLICVERVLKAKIHSIEMRR